jgi:hypothetical protein
MFVMDENVDPFSWALCRIFTTATKRKACLNLRVVRTHGQVSTSILRLPGPRLKLAS